MQPLLPNQQQVDRGMALVQKYKRRRLTLEECYELIRWFDEAYLNNPNVTDDQKALVMLMKGGVNAVRVDLEYHA